MYNYKATVLKVIDGDTVTIDVDLGFSIRQKMTLRLYGINAPEKVGISKAAGLASTEFLKTLLPVNTPVLITTYKDSQDKYGRILAEIYQNSSTDQESINQIMVSSGHAQVYKP